MRPLATRRVADAADEPVKMLFARGRENADALDQLGDRATARRA